MLINNTTHSIEVAYSQKIIFRIIKSNSYKYLKFDDIDLPRYSFYYISRTNVSSSLIQKIKSRLNNANVEKAFHALDGPCMILIIDNKNKIIRIAGDKIGHCKIYWHKNDNIINCSLSVNSLVSQYDQKEKINRDVLSSYMRFGYISAPHSIYTNIHKLVPGAYLEVAIDSHGIKTRIKNYYDFEKTISLLVYSDCSDDSSKTNNLENILVNNIKDSLNGRIGVFLSGGIDSSLITAIAQKHYDAKVPTFTIGFKEKDFNESDDASAIANYLNTEHINIIASPHDALRIIKKLFTVYDEPFADSSQIATLLAFELASQSVDVVLGGDGADELFGGYTPLQFAPQLWDRISKLPYASRRLISSFIVSLINALRYAGFLGTYFLSKNNVSNKIRQLIKLSSILGARNQRELFLNLSSSWNKPDDLVLGATEVSTFYYPNKYLKDIDDFQLYMMALSTCQYLPFNGLVKVDAAAAYTGVNALTPFLTNEIFDLAWYMQKDLKIKNGVGKWPVREILYTYIPRSLVDKPKKGFSVPIGEWLKGPLKEWANDMLDPSTLKRQGYLNHHLVDKTWQYHLNGHVDNGSKLWKVLMFQEWFAQRYER